MSRLLRTVLVAAALVATRSGDARAQAAPPGAEEAATLLEGADDARAESGVLTRDIPFADLVTGEGDLSLIGVRAARYVTFGIPEQWRLVGPPELFLDVTRSGQLLPEASRIDVSVDGQKAGEVKLDGPADGVGHARLKLPLSRVTGFHALQLDGHQRSQLPCELADHPGLWSRVLASSFVRVRYRLAPPTARLSDWPLPFVDPRDPFVAHVVLVLPAAPSPEEIQAAGYVASALGAASRGGRVDLTVFLGDVEDAPDGNVVAVARADGGASASLVRLLAARGGDAKAIASEVSGATLLRAGALVLVPRPGHADNAVLVVAGADGQGLVDLARALARRDARGLPPASTARLDPPDDTGDADARRWRGAVPPEAAFTLGDLGYDDLTASGERGGTVSVPLLRVPDERPIDGEAKVELDYSWSPDVDPARSRVTVLVDGAGAGGAALTDPSGSGHLEVALPVRALGPAGRLEVRFDLAPREESSCIGDEVDPLWGTVHADSRVTLPRELVPRANDLAELRYGAFPFGVRPDLADTLFVLPAAPDRASLQLYAWLAAELGRLAPGDGFAYGVRLGALRTSADRDRDLVVVDAGDSPRLLGALHLLPSLWVGRRAADRMGTAFGSGARVSLADDPGVAWFEELAAPWNEARTALVVHADDGGAFVRVGPSAGRAPLLERLGGRVSRVAALGDVVQVAAGAGPVATAEAAPAARPSKQAKRLLAPGASLAAALVGLGLGVRQRNRRPDEGGGR